ncbi:MAG: hypothetical protein M1469_11895 [Bacteroidetes bacterium]|nr:hypothetical protein [Bacteroidota bacterium]
MERISSPWTPVGTVTTVGKGKIVVLATSYLFSDRKMGFSSVIPDSNMRGIYDLEYLMFKKYISNDKSR